MSDDDAATDSTNGDSADDTTAKADRTSADADVTAGADTDKDVPQDAPEQDAATEDAVEKKPKSDNDAADATVKMSTADAAAEGSAAEAKSVPADDATVKMSTAASSPGSSATAAKSTPADEKAVKLPTAKPPRPAAEPIPASRNWMPIVGAFAAGVVVVAAAAAVTVFWKQDHDRGKDLSARDSAVAAACDFGRQVGTYNAANFDDYVNRVKARSTGDWLTQFDGASSALKQITQQAQARSTVSEIHCAWESGDTNNASVVLLITQSQSKAATPQPQHLTIGVVASLEKKDGKWLVGNFQSPMTNDLQGEAQPSAPGATPSAPGTATTPGN